MNSELKNRPNYASLHVELNRGESVVTETGAMMSMSTGLDMSTNMKGGILGAASRLVGGETIFQNTYTANEDGQSIEIVPKIPGDMEEIDIEGTVIVQSGSYVASTPDVKVSAKWGGAKSFFGGEGLIMLRCTGNGLLWIASYGAIHHVAVQGAYTVDTSHIVAFEDSLSFTIGKVGGIKSLFLSQEGLVCKFKGHGNLWLQTRNAPSLAGFLHPFRRVKSNKS